MEIDIKALKEAAPLIPYVKKHYPNRIVISEELKTHAKAGCIFHNEKTASLTLFANGTYKCYGCGEHGDIFTLVQYLENLTFLESCKMIGDNVGYEVILTPPNPYHEAYKDAMDEHTRRYWCNFQNSAEAKQYMIVDRGLSQETLTMFRIGLTDQNEYQYRKDIGSISNRISFPILENKILNPKCVGMGYRTMKENEKPKYINDCNQEGREKQDPNLAGVFIKGNFLYGYPMAHEAIKKMGFAILVEGYVDVLSLYQAGIKNSLCAMGTSITPAQIATIKKVTNSVLLILDGDNAGVNAMLKILPLFFSEGISVIVCRLDKGLDPADLCKKYAFNHDKVYGAIRENSIQAEVFMINNAVSRYETIINREREKALETALPVFNTISDPIKRDVYMNMLYNRLDLRR